VTALLPATKRKIIDGYDREFRAWVAEEIAAAIEASAPVPAETCDERWCHCHSRREQADVDAATAREIGRVT
jgi:hypothetical protein